MVATDLVEGEMLYLARRLDLNLAAAKLVGGANYKILSMEFSQVSKRLFSLKESPLSFRIKLSSFGNFVVINMILLIPALERTSKCHMKLI